MKRKERDGNEDDEKNRLCRTLDLKMATVTRLPATSTHQKTLPHRVESMKRKERYGNEDDDDDSCKFDSLPLDLKMAIVSRLGAKTLMKFRCVSKMWSSIIRSRGFIDSFFSMSSTTQSRFIVAFSNNLSSEPDFKLTFFLSFSQDEGEESSLVPNFEMALPVGLSSHKEAFTSLHGFLTVCTTDGLMMVCNPCTEQVIKLHSSTRFVGFVGYDPIDGQHKALFLESESPVNCSGHLHHKVLTLGGSCQGWRHIEPTPGPYSPVTVGACVNGIIYYGARNSDRFKNPVMVCFDVRSEKLSFIQAPEDVVHFGLESIFIDYNGKLASIVRYPYASFTSFDLWILEDAEKHKWSKQNCVFPSSVWDSVWGGMSFPGTNKAGKIIMAPKTLSVKVEPFYIFYYNVKTKNIRRVRLLGIGDDKEFRRSYGFLKKHGIYQVRIAPQHVDSIASL